MYESLKCLQKYSKTCLPTFPKQAMTIFLLDMGEVIDARCKDNDVRTRKLITAFCLSKSTTERVIGYPSTKQHYNGGRQERGFI